MGNIWKTIGEKYQFMWINWRVKMNYVVPKNRIRVLIAEPEFNPFEGRKKTFFLNLFQKMA